MKDRRFVYDKRLKPKIYIVILNFKGWANTIECLESVIRIHYLNYQVIVIDNNSPDGSMDQIISWAEDRMDVWNEPANPLRRLSNPPVKKPLWYIFYRKEGVEIEGSSETESREKNPLRGSEKPTTSYPIVLIQNSVNLGFAGGNNVGARYALTKGDFEYIWFLNNDTVVERDSLDELVELSAKHKKAGRKTGIFGSKLLFYDSPARLQGVWGRYNKWLATTKHVGAFEQDLGQYDGEMYTDEMDYVIGASMFVDKAFMADVGLMCADYFLYFEEIDWAERGRQRGWEIGYCWKSKIYHKEGESTGCRYKSKEKKAMPDYYGLRNRILFTKKFFPGSLWSVYLSFIFVFLNRIKRGQFGLVKGAIRAMLNINIDSWHKLN